MKVLLLLVLPYCMAVDSDWNSPNCENGESVQDTLDPSIFYICDNNEWKPYYCSPGSTYNHHTGFCEYADTSRPDLACGPPTDCPPGAYFPDNCDCTKFYQCDHGEAVHMSCGPGTAFNPKISVCDWPHNVPNS